MILKSILNSLLVFIFLLIKSTYSLESTLCISLIKESNDEATWTQNINTNIKRLLTQTGACIEALLVSGNYNSWERYLSWLNENNIRYRDNLSNAINNVQQRLNSINNKFKFQEADYQWVLPAFQWAQSLDNVFWEVKFAHRHDSPGCIEMSKLDLNLTNTTFALTAYCVWGDVPIKFELDLELTEDIDPELSTHGTGSVGRYQINLQKKNTTYWKKLAKDESKYYPNMRVWFEMKAKYEEEIKEFEKIDEDEEFKQEYENMQREYEEKRELKKLKKQERKNMINNGTLSNSNSTNSTRKTKGKKNKKNKNLSENKNNTSSNKAEKSDW